MNPNSLCKATVAFIVFFVIFSVTIGCKSKAQTSLEFLQQSGADVFFSSKGETPQDVEAIHFFDIGFAEKDLVHLKNFPHLEDLTLAGDEFTVASLDVLDSLPNLKFLSIAGPSFRELI